jgi:beta-mannosidase
MRTTWLHDGWRLAARRWLAPPGRHGFSALEWLPARVPGHVHLDLLRHQVIADPFRGLHELGLAWVDEEDWVYRTTFDFTPDPALPRRVLRFEGLDTVATVFLNGAEVARHDDMFVPLELDATGLLQAGTNELRVELASAVRVGRERRARYLAAEGLDPATLRFDEQAFVRKAQYMFGWDWGPRLVSAGLWQPVALLEHGGRLLDVRCRQRHLPGGDVELTVTSEHEEAGEPLQAVHFLEGRDAPLRDGETVRLERPERWSPTGHGAQRLHRLETLLVPAGAEDRAAAERAARDRRTVRLGFREVELRQEPDAAGSSFELLVNGRPVWCVGASWIPDHSLPSAVSPQRLRAQLLRARGMNMNMLRVWGGGLYESEAFYDACDELGLLVWQDFAYACSYYPDDEAALEAAGREARAAVRRLRHHPSLALWCGNNENQVMFQDKWEDPARHPPRLYGEAIYQRVLPAVLADEDPDRPYVPGSPMGTAPGGTRINAGGAGDQHCWDVWHGRGDWVFYSESTARFCSEFGFASAPGQAALRRMFAGGEPDPLRLPADDRVARWHDKTLKPLATFRALVELHYPAAHDLEEWAYTSQLNQRDALRHGIEHWRRSPLCRGTLVWQLNDCWPVQSWALVDAQGEPKCAAQELRRLYAPALASLAREGPMVRLWTLLQNADQPVRGQARLEARSLLSGAVLGALEAEVELAPGELRLALEADVSAFDPATTIVLATFAGTRTFRLLAEPKDAILPAAVLTARLAGDRLVLRTDAPVVDLLLWDAGGGLALGENWLTLPEAGEVELPASGLLRGRLCARSLRGRHEIVPG